MKRLCSLLILSALTAFTLFSCSDSESRLPIGGNTRVIINLGLQPDRQEVSFLDRLLRILSRDAIAEENAPASFSSITVRVTAPDIGILEKSFPPSRTVTMTVPSGSIRTFEVTALVSPYDPDNSSTWTAAESFKGITQVNLPSGTTVSLPVLMKLKETKIIFPDYYNDRLVIMDSMKGTPRYLYTVDYSGDTVPITGPRDVDFDSRGRLYIVYASGLERCDDLNGSNGFALDYTTTLSTVAVDRSRDLVYFTDGGTIFRRNLDGSLPASLPDTVNTGLYLSSIHGLAVAQDGSVLVTGYDNEIYANGIFRLDASASQSGVTASFTDSEYMNGMVPDIMSKGIYLYVLNPYPSYEPYDKKLMQFVKGPGDSFTLVNDGPLESNGSFVNAGHFSSLRNGGLIIMDKTFSTPDSKIIFMRDVWGSGWTEYSDETLDFYDYAQGG